jgi:hypothetical protein
MITPLYAPVPFDLRYWASNTGEILSFASGARKFLKQPKNKKGYPCVCLRGKRVLSHRVITMSFGLSISNGMQVNHIDGVKHNNSISNLEIVSQVENMQHAKRLGLLKPLRKGDNPMAKINQEIADKMRKIYAAGGSSYPKLGKQFGVSKSLVELVIKHRIWVS